MNNKFDTLFSKTNAKGHYSKEIYYKLILSSLFPNLNKIMVTDVDVVFMNDISDIYNSFNINEDNYIYAPIVIGKNDPKSPKCKKLLKKLNKMYSKYELEKLKWAGGFYIYNLKKMREDNIEEKLIKFAQENSSRLLQPEQDTINLVCYPKIKTMPPNSLVCTYAYTMFNQESDYHKDINHTKEEIVFSLNKPIQLHYATGDKPWNCICTKWEIWYEYIIKTPLFNTFIKKLLNKNKYKILFSIKIPLYKKGFSFIKHK